MSMTPNINDENFGTSSGIALKYISCFLCQTWPKQKKESSEVL